MNSQGLLGNNACAHGVYQALSPPLKGPGDEARFYYTVALSPSSFLVLHTEKLAFQCATLGILLKYNIYIESSCTTW